MVNSSSANNQSTRVSMLIKAPRKAVYQAFLDPHALASWLPPNDMTGQVHEFDPRVGGRFRISLTYKHAERSLPGKTSADTDTVQGRFVELIPSEKIVQIVEFESQQPEFAGEMTITATYADAPGGTEVTMLCENIPKGIRPGDNEMGCRESLQKLAALLE
jgi:uncharacterized protein YndB with AHSA1/START domain